METKGNVSNKYYYDLLRKVPEKAKKPIKGGRLNGMTNISPMWRIERMTEVFGVCGFGWKYEITKQWRETYGEEVKTYCNVNLYVKINGEWSEPIPGTGGSAFASKESSRIYVDDEDQKKALTDALSVAMKSLGVGADVYLNDSNYDSSKYSNYTQATAAPQNQVPPEGRKEPQMSAQIQGEILACKDMAELNAVWNKYLGLQLNKEFREKWAVQRGNIEGKGK